MTNVLQRMTWHSCHVTMPRDKNCRYSDCEDTYHEDREDTCHEEREDTCHEDHEDTCHEDHEDMSCGS